MSENRPGPSAKAVPRTSLGLIRRALGGALAGAVATLPMSGVFAAAQRAHFIGTLPPRKLVRSLGVADEIAQGGDAAAAVLHLLIGAASGAGFAALVPRRAVGVRSGIAFGLLLWVSAYEFVMPVLTTIPVAHHDRRSRALTIVAAHAVYGACLGALTRPLLRRCQARP